MNIQLIGTLVVAFVFGWIAQSPPPVAPVLPRQNSLLLLHDGIPDPEFATKGDQLGAHRWLQVNQDEASYQTGVIDAEVVLRDVGLRTSLRPPPWAILDFEDPFFVNLSKPANSPERIKSVQTMKEALAAAKRRYPGTKWSFYGLPNLPFWVNGKGWTILDAAQREAAVAAALDSCRDVLSDADWISVSVYDYYDPTLVIPGRTDSISGTPQAAVANGIAWRKAQVAAARAIAGSRPVIPMACPYWAPGGIAPVCRVIAAEDFLARQVVPCVEAGADGIAIWANYGYRIDRVQSRDPESSTVERNFGRADWQRAFTADFLAGTTPPDWSDLNIRLKLIRECSGVILDRLARIRELPHTSHLPH